MAQPSETIVTRTGKGTPVTTAEMDANLTVVENSPFHIGFTTWWFADEASIPTGWLPLDGREISQATYSRLFDVIGNRYGTGTGTFFLPDTRGRFIRMVDDTTAEGSAGVDPDESGRTAATNGAAGEAGSTQDHALDDHTHNQYGSLISAASGAQPDAVNSVTPNYEATSGAIGANVSTETRPTNMYAILIIRAL